MKRFALASWEKLQKWGNSIEVFWAHESECMGCLYVLRVETLSH